MRKGRTRGGGGLDITPLIDVLFMLIIFFVLTTAFVQGAIVVELPKGAPPPVEKENPIVLTVTKEAEFLWAGEPVSRDQMIARAVRAAAEGAALLVAGDREAKYGDVAELLEGLRRSGVKDVGIAFEESAP